MTKRPIGIIERRNRKTLDSLSKMRLTTIPHAENMMAAMILKFNLTCLEVLGTEFNFTEKQLIDFQRLTHEKFNLKKAENDDNIRTADQG